MNEVIESKGAAISPYNVTIEAIGKMREQYAGLDAQTSYEPVRLAIADIRDRRVGIEKRRKELKSGLLDEGRRIDATAKELTSLLEEIEAPLKASKQLVDDEKARVKREREEAERKAIEDALRKQRDEEESKLRAEREAEESKLAAERERLAALQAQIAEEQRVKDAADELARKESEERQLIEREALEAERAKMAAERAELEAMQRAADEAARAAEMAERERLAKIQADADALARVEREKAEAEEARIAQLEREKRERELREEMAPDLEKIAAFADKLLAIKAPSVKSENIEVIIARGMAAIEDFANELADTVKDVANG